jgi:hypothetical protein
VLIKQQFVPPLLFKYGDGTHEDRMKFPLSLSHYGGVCYNIPALSVPLGQLAQIIIFGRRPRSCGAGSSLSARPESPLPFM